MIQVKADSVARVFYNTDYLGGTSPGLPSLPERGQERAERIAAQLTEHHRKEGAIMDSPIGFIDLSRVVFDDYSNGIFQNRYYHREIRSALHDHLYAREMNAANLLDIFSEQPYKSIYQGENYYDRGPVLVGPAMLSKIFPGIILPTTEQIEARNILAKEFYGTMPGIEAAYLGAMLTALAPRSVLMIGEHRGILTEHVAQSVPKDCLIYTVDFPKSLWGVGGRAEPDALNKVYVNFDQKDLGSRWRDSGQEYVKRIVPFAGDTTFADDREKLIRILYQQCDCVIVDGDHSKKAVLSDLKLAAELVTKGGVIFLDDFDKPMRLHPVEYAAEEFREESGRKLFHLSWGAGKPEEQIKSNLAFFLPREN